MALDYHVDWLTARDAKRIAAVEHRVHSREQRAGIEEIEEDQEEADYDGANLSLGLYLGRQLVGYLLAYHEQDCQRIFEYLGMEAPLGLDLSGPGVFLADYGVYERHRRAAGSLFARLAAMRERPDLADLPVVVFCTQAMRELWQSKARLFARFGYTLEQDMPIATPGTCQLYLLVFRATLKNTPRVRGRSLDSLLRHPVSYPTGGGEENVGELTIGVIDSMAGWTLLEPVWNRLLDQTPAHTVFQTYEYLQCWWQHVGKLSELRIFVALRDGEVIGIAPMYTSLTWWLGKPLRCLHFLGQPSEADRPTLLVAPEHGDVAVAMADYIVGQGALWDRLVLFEQPADSAFFVAVQEKLRAAKLLVSVVGIPVCAYVSIEGSWPEYLASRSKAFRKNVKRKLTQLNKAGSVEYSVESYRYGETADLLEEYLAVERASWKVKDGVGVGRSSGHITFYRALSLATREQAAVEFKFLRVDGRTIAATFGINWRGYFYSLHIVHDQAFADYSPGLVLTAYELQEAFEKHKYHTLDFLGGFLTNKLSWATGGIETVALFAHKPGVRNWLFHWLMFTARPHVRRWLIKYDLLGAMTRLRDRISDKIYQLNLWS